MMKAAAWQEEYARELMRTTGQSCAFEPCMGGGWWRLAVDGREQRTRVRRADVLRMTERLRREPR